MELFTFRYLYTAIAQYKCAIQIENSDFYSKYKGSIKLGGYWSKAIGQNKHFGVVLKTQK